MKSNQMKGIIQLHPSFYVKAAVSAVFLGMAWFFSFNPALNREMFLNFSVWFLIVFIFTKIKKTDFFIIDADRFLLACFALLIVISGIGYSVEIGIPRYRTVLRIFFYVYLILITTRPLKKISIDLLYISTFFLFSSFLFQWEYTLGELKNLPLFILSGMMLYRSAFEKNAEFPLPLSLLFSVLAFSLLFSNAANLNVIFGTDEFFLAATAMAVFAAVYRKITEEEILYLINALVFLFSLYFAVSISLRILIDPNYHLIFKKSAFLAGVNVNDISGFYTIALPFALIFFKYSKKLAALNVSLLFIILFIAKSRYPLLLAFAILALYFILEPEGIFHKHKGKILLFFIAMGVLSSVLIIVFSDQLAYLLRTNSLEIRKDLQIFAVSKISQNFFTGTGINNLLPLLTHDPSISSEEIPRLSKFLSSGHRIPHFHSTPLQLWLNGGFLYFTAYAVLIIGALYAAFKKRENIFVMAAFLSVLSFILEGMLNYHMMNHSYLFILWISFALIFKNTNFHVRGHKIKLMPYILIPGGMLAVLFIFILGVHASLLNSLRTVRAWDNFDNLILDTDSRTIDKKDMEKANRYAELTGKFGFAERRFCQQHAEVEFMNYRNSGSPEDETSAGNSYNGCIAGGMGNPLIYYRLSQTTGKDRAAELLSTAEKTDRFNLLNKWHKSY